MSTVLPILILMASIVLLLAALTVGIELDDGDDE